MYIQIDVCIHMNINMFYSVVTHILIIELFEYSYLKHMSIDKF